jgi:hypothetical protein
MQIIPWPDFPEWEQQIQLDGVSYRLRGRYNTTSERWTMDILASDKAPIVLGIGIVRGVDLLLYHVDSRLPPGSMVVIGDVEPNRVNMGRSVQLVYDNATV